MAQIISLDSLKAPVSPESMRAQLAAGGCESSSCGSSDGPADMDPAVWAKVKDHPCYSEEAHHYFARMHVAVAPACNRVLPRGRGWLPPRSPRPGNGVVGSHLWFLADTSGLFIRLGESKKNHVRYVAFRSPLRAMVFSDSSVQQHDKKTPRQTSRMTTALRGVLQDVFQYCAG